MRLKRITEFALSLVLVLAAVAVAAAAVRTAFFPRGMTARPAAEPFRYIEGWEEFRNDGTLIGDPAAPVTIVEFSDLQCPFCQRFHRVLQDVESRFGDQVAVLFVHFPLQSHPDAFGAALAAECAEDQGRFKSFVDLLYLQQDSLGSKPWIRFAGEAGVPDTLEFQQCVAARGGVGKIYRGREHGSELGLRGTPSVLVNGWLFGEVPYDTLPEVIDRALRREPPFDLRPGG